MDHLDWAKEFVSRLRVNPGDKRERGCDCRLDIVWYDSFYMLGENLNPKSFPADMVHEDTFGQETPEGGDGR